MNDLSGKVSSAATVKESAAMMMPSLQSMLKRREYPVLTVPPICHARLSGDPESMAYALTYNGIDVIRMRFGAACKPSLRFHSDGDYQSRPFLQQFVIAADRETELTVTVSFPHEMVVLRPGRAKSGQAILGQWGHPLIDNINGLYSLVWDYFISWHGYDFTWQHGSIREENGVFSAAFAVRLHTKPFVILLKPRFYGMHLGYESHKPWLRRPKDEAVSGWCSWEAYHDKVTQEHVTAAAQALTPLKNYGLNTLQLDDGYQNPLVPPAAGKSIGESWLQTNEKFPSGHAGIVKAIRNAGFRAGIWTNATLTNLEACEMLPYMLRKPDGKLIYGDWIQYVIDCTPEMLEKEITPYYRALREAGYGYIKSDSIRHLIFDGLQEAVRLGLLSDDEAQERMISYMRAARKGIGEDAYYLSCWGALTQSIGVCDAMRVATDANANWHAYSMQLRETARWFFAQRILFTVDPDHVCVRGELNWVRMMLSMVTLTGGLYMISDKPESYDEKRLELIRKTLPGATVRAAETGSVNYETPACYSIRQGVDLTMGSYEIGHYEKEEMPFASLWCTHFEKDGRRWCVMQRCAVTPLTQILLSVKALNLPEDRVYYAFDFWDQTGRVVSSGTVALPALPLGDTTVLGLYDITDRKPCLVGSDRHITMDVVSVAAAKQCGNGLVLDLNGFAGLVCKYAVYAPDASGTIASEGGSASCTRFGDVYTVEVRFDTDHMKVRLE
jgi:alpha-galactosidase